MVVNVTNFGGILSGPLAVLGFFFQLILLASLTDALAEWNETLCERISSISFILECFLYESMLRFIISLSVNDELVTSNFKGIHHEIF